MGANDLPDGAIREGDPPYIGDARRGAESTLNGVKPWKLWHVSILVAVPIAMGGLAFALFLSLDETRHLKVSKQAIQHEPWFTNGDPTARPIASRHETSITLQPSKASLTIPEEWVQWHEQFGNNIHLTREQLDRVARGDGEFDTEYASVCNTVLPFDRCGLHAGGEGWGPEAVGWQDLQMRIYDLQDTPEEVELRITGEGLTDAKRHSRKAPVLVQDLTAQWRQTRLSFEVF